MGHLTIGQLAKAAGVAVETVRFYERQGLLPDPARLASGYRQYDPVAVERLRFVRHAQRLGFTLKEVAELLVLRDDPAADREDVRRKAVAKLADIDARIADLEQMRDALRSLADECDGRGPASSCPILRALVAPATYAAPNSCGAGRRPRQP